MNRTLRAVLVGVGSVLDLFGTSFDPPPLPPRRTPEEALAADWRAVWDDMRAVMGQGSGRRCYRVTPTVTENQTPCVVQRC